MRHCLDFALVPRPVTALVVPVLEEAEEERAKKVEARTAQYQRAEAPAQLQEARTVEAEAGAEQR